jgi:hypothetical protein
VDKPIDAARRSIQLNDKSAHAHSLLTDSLRQKNFVGQRDVRGPEVWPQGPSGKRQSHGVR